MTFETMKECASLFQCRLTDNGDSVTFEFPKVTMKIAKDFNTGETEAVLFVLKGWLDILKEVLESEAQEPQQGK
jgi:hypothetical protein